MSFSFHRFKAARKEKGWTQQTLADLLHVSRGTVAMWETGKNTPPADMLQKLAELFDCSVGYLMGTEEEINAQRRLDEMHADVIDYLDKKLETMRSQQAAAQQAREELAYDPDRKALLNLARYGSAQDVKQVAALIDALRATNPDFYDGDDPA